MAREEKKKELSLEEKLAQALVPEEEQPYEVPENWCWTYLKNIAQWGSGGTPSRKNHAFYDGCIPWVKSGELEDDYLYDTEEKISEEAIQKSSAKLFPEETVLIAMYGATIGKTAILGVDAATNQACACAICNGFVYNKYLFYYLRLQKDKFIEQGKGGAQPNISQDIIKKNCIPIPPKNEQQYIVERVESLFAKLDEVKEKVQGVLDTFEDRKAAILYKAFQGELTVQWRYENNVDIDTWRVKQLDEVCKSIFDGDHMPPPKSESGIHFLVISNVNTGYLSFENTRYVPQEYYDGLTATRKPEKGDILYTLVGTYGIPIVVDSDTPFCFQRHMGLLKLDGIDTHFLWYQMQSQEFYNKATEIANGTAQLTVPIKGLRKLKVSCPSVAEQKELVQILNSLFEKENETKQLVESVLNNVSLLKKSILAKAFRGELETNNPKEESSIELLKKILANA